MNRRTLALAAVLAIVAAVALGRRAFDRDDPVVNAAATTAESTAAKNPYRAIAQPEHPRIHDSLDILAPFNARLARELDAFNDDLGIDVHVVTSNDTSQSIEAQSEQLFPQRNIGILQTLGERALYLGFPEITIALLEKIGGGVELTLAEAYNQTGDSAGAHRWVDRALKENPYDVYALYWKAFLATREKHADEAAQLRSAMQDLVRDPQQKAQFVELSFNPRVPKYDSHTTLDVNGTKVYDHSHFGVTMRNASRRDVEVESVMLGSFGTGAASGLGDIKGYWKFPAGGNRLRAGESVSFDKLWGFVTDTSHEHVRYVFHTCWHGVGTTVRQCRTQWVDVIP